MLRKIWRNKLEFYPYLAILAFWFFGSFVQSFMLTDRPEIVVRGLITIPPVVLVAAAIVKTYRTLPENGTLPGPGDK